MDEKKINYLANAAMDECEYGLKSRDRRVLNTVQYIITRNSESKRCPQANNAMSLIIGATTCQ